MVNKPLIRPYFWGGDVRGGLGDPPWFKNGSQQLLLDGSFQLVFFHREWRPEDDNDICLFKWIEKTFLGLEQQSNSMENMMIWEYLTNIFSSLFVHITLLQKYITIKEPWTKNSWTKITWGSDFDIWRYLVRLVSEKYRQPGNSAGDLCGMLK